MQRQAERGVRSSFPISKLIRPHKTETPEDGAMPKILDLLASQSSSDCVESGPKARAGSLDTMADGKNKIKDPMDSVRKGALLSVFTTIFLDLVGFGMLIPILPLIARDFGAGDAQATALASIYSVGTLLSVGMLGRWSDLFGRKKILTGTIIISLVAQVLTGLAPDYNLLIIARFIAGLASGNIAVAQACISDITTPQQRGKSMALIGIAFGLGFALGPALGALISMFSAG
ncbi:MAG: MFS transporter, partial [Proteobacteria bacterium]